MAEYYAFQAAICFSIAHIFVRRGLVYSNALTGSLISLGTTTTIFWLLAVLFIPLPNMIVPAMAYFIAAGIFAPGIGQTLGYIGMERIGVARSAPIVNTSPIFSSLLAVSLLDEVWTVQNVIGTCLVILSVVILSSDRPTQRQWRKSDIAYPVLGAMAFGISTTLRKSGLNEFPNPLLAAAVTVGTAFLVLCAIVHFGFGRRALQFNHQGSGWLFAAALLNACAILSLFFALNIGRIVEVEPLVACNPLLTLLWTAIFLRGIERLSRRIVISAIATVAGTVLVITAH